MRIGLWLLFNFFEIIRFAVHVRKTTNQLRRENKLFHKRPVEIATNVHEKVEVNFLMNELQMFRRKRSLKYRSHPMNRLQKPRQDLELQGKTAREMF